MIIQKYLLPFYFFQLWIFGVLFPFSLCFFSHFFFLPLLLLQIDRDSLDISPFGIGHLNKQDGKTRGAWNLIEIFLYLSIWEPCNVGVSRRKGLVQVVDLSGLIDMMGWWVQCWSLVMLVFGRFGTPVPCVLSWICLLSDVCCGWEGGSWIGIHVQ